MNLTGMMLIGGRDVAGSGKEIRAIDPATGTALDPVYRDGTSDDINQAVALAEAAFDSYRHTTPEQRATFLDTVAERILGLGDVLIERLMAETGLPRPRLEGERGRTVNQLRLFARVVRKGDWLGVRVDHAQPERTPMPRSDLRFQYIPVGPVVVFGASNFPLAFSVAGGDTASALAAGAPVIVKGHPAHPGGSELVGRAIRQAVHDCGLHEGVFSLVFGSTPEFGQALVSHAGVKSVGFTGSRAGGLALMKAAAARSEPIPVFAEMSSINPVFLLPAALESGAERIADGFAASLVGSAGQLCTNPGLVIAVDSPALDRFIQRTTEALGQAPASTMLTPGIHAAYQRGVTRVSEQAGVQVQARSRAASQDNGCQAVLFTTSADTFLAGHEVLGQEVFGAASMVIRCKDVAQFYALAKVMEGQLTATLHCTDEDDPQLIAGLLRLLELKAGRLLVNGFPTGVEVCDAMVHGGPFPATSDPRSTSVGTAAIHRFLRPVCYQDIPDAALPPALQRANPWNVGRSETH